MRKIVLLLLLLLAKVPSFAQNFNKLFTIEGVHTTTTGCALLNNFIYVTGRMSDTLEFANGLKTFVAKFDANGNLLAYKTFRDSIYLHFVATTYPIIVNQKIYVSGYMRDTTSIPNSFPPFHAFLLQIDTDLNSSIITNIVDSLSQYFSPASATYDFQTKNFYLTGSIRQLTNDSTVVPYNSAFIIKLDSQGRFIKRKIFNLIHREKVYGLTTICKNLQLYMTINGDSDIYIGDPISHIRTINYLLRLDTSCNLINTMNYSDSNAVATNSTILFNNRFYGCGAYINTRVTQWNGTGYILNKPSLFKFNANYQLIAKDSFGNNYNDKGFIKIKLVSNENNFILVGRNQTPNNGVDSGGVNGIILKVDTLGNLIWEHQFRGFSYPAYPIDANNQFIDVGFLLDGSIIVCGNAIMDNFTIPINHQGWLMRLSPDGCLSSSDCGYETGMNELAPVANEREHSTNIFPNPSDQFIQLSYQGACSEKMQVEIYSALGQRMLHEEYSAAQTNKRLETAQLQNGIYFYKLYCNYREVGQGKFVVQR